jgi:ABC-type molybdenum transport system ATPase subunit/photorepair protein PhrA
VKKVATKQAQQRARKMRQLRVDVTLVPAGNSPSGLAQFYHLWYAPQQRISFKMASDPHKIIYSMIGVSKYYDKKPVIKDISLSFFYGAKIGVLGLNGSGVHHRLLGAGTPFRRDSNRMGNCQTGSQGAG